MKLFNESENKYYELIAFLLNNQDSYTREELQEITKNRVQGEPDFEVTDALFAGDEENRLFFKKEGQKFQPIMNIPFPIRTNTIENQAAKAMISDKYIHHFLRPETVEKLRVVTEDVEEEWNLSDIVIKNIFENGDSKATESLYQNLSVIISAIRQRKSIRYDNVRPGRVERVGAEAFPVKIEFSVINDKFRVCAYEPSERRFFKMNLATICNVSMGCGIAADDLMEDYQDFIKAKTKKLVLDVEPDLKTIERCFLVFSYYDRKARYDKEEERYRLEISYMESDENEMIKNILSMGSCVTVLEPRAVKKEVYRRILAASKLYEE